MISWWNRMNEKKLLNTYRFQRLIFQPKFVEKENTSIAKIIQILKWKLMFWLDWINITTHYMKQIRFVENLH